MAFGCSKVILMNTLKKMGAEVEDSPNQEHYLLVNNEYEICYTNFSYRKVGEDISLGRGKQSFLSLIQQENVKK